MPLTDNLIGHWKLNEASGSRADSHGSNPLTDNNTVTQAVGKIDEASQHTAANAEWLDHVSNSDLQTGDIDFTVAGWFYADSLAAPDGLASKGADAADEWLLYFTASRLRFYIWGGAGPGYFFVSADDLGLPVINTWYFVVGWHDATADTVNIQVNDGDVNSATTSGNFPAAAAGAFTLGRYRVDSDLWDGRVDSFSFWKRLLTSGERTSLYNGGAGLDYPFSTGAGDEVVAAMMQPDNLFREDPYAVAY